MSEFWSRNICAYIIVRLKSVWIADVCLVDGMSDTADTVALVVLYAIPLLFYR